MMEITPGTRQEFIGEHDLQIGKFLFYTNVIIGEFYEGMHVNKENVMDAIQVVRQTYGKYKPIVYISHRLNSYSTDPTSYKEVSALFPNLKGFAIVSKNKYRRMLAKLEKIFVKKPTRAFDNLESAFFWAEQLLENKLDTFRNPPISR